METNHTYCCTFMQNSINDPRIPLGYSPIMREYYINMNNAQYMIQEIFYCPWCGNKLPGSLRDEYFNILAREYHIEPDLDIKNNDRIPLEFKSDEWWKKRGL